MYTLQTSVIIGQASFKIADNGDFRMVLDCFNALNDIDLTEREQMYSALIIFYEDINGLDDIVKYNSILYELQLEMSKFMNGGKLEENQEKSRYRLIDWDKDSNLICSAINKVANKEIRALDYLHWWTFLGYYMAIGESPLSTIVGIRNKIARGKKLEDYEKRFRQENPEYFNMDYRTMEEQQAEKYVRNLWGE